MIKKRKRVYKEPSADRFSSKAMFSNPVASANDCTGITPTIPETEEEAESYCNLADIPVTSRDGGQAFNRAK